MSKSVLLPTSYLPNIQYFTKVISGVGVLIEANETYPKQTYRNRCEILSANGRLTLSVPVKRVQGNHTPVTLVEIENATLWQKNHWRAIESAYRTSAYFDFVADVLLPYYNKRYSNLFEFNCDLFRAVLNFLGIKVNIERTSDFVLDIKPDFRTLLSPKCAFEADTNFVPTEYFQVFFEKFGFIANLSVIDLLFNEGLNTVEILKQSTR